MPYSGSGVFLELISPEFPAVAGEYIIAEYYNEVIRDIHLGLGNAITRDGQSPALANLPMGGFKHTGAGIARGSGQYLTFDQATALYIPWREFTTDYTAIITDEGKGLCLTAATAPRTFTLPANAAVPMLHGASGGFCTAITFLNLAPHVLSIAIAGGDTLRQIGPGGTGTRSLAQYGLATALKVNATTWVINGTGLT
jgi:hypothetical protein